ncbi:3'-5' exonuclease [Reichenbachiella agarivorans]|uniref:3'-5' exonuclease n=1 Tax=Reichenbachiella agarivorans TaxID=2979464 RepID=A0ABY6CSN8_9BACT|nr:3'-5' exonuclease [Reichenbachiella agarivorans]UXP33534.1 3'-5' exonuclease [Reichenbachiella agarivorans]
MNTLTNLNHLIFIDIETASAVQDFGDLDEKFQELWIKKADQLNREEEYDPQEFYFERAGIYAEFGKIICISVGMLHYDMDRQLQLRVKALASGDEKELLQSFIDLFRQLDQSKIQLCAHNGKEFDFPYISRRMLINQLTLPPYLELSGKKPWEVQHLDTMQMWKFGDWKNYTSLELLTQVFGIPSPKGDIDGSDVNRVYYEEQDLTRIAHYCNQDVIATIQVFLKMKGLDMVDEDNISIVS